ncbi:MAG: DUF4198 domain-containing protein [Thermoguttaceae bacterium]|nr:DUF4198 domain-containing protein [Thermoguttaceae bacterium]MDW8039438.1 hypothetical protein [Thermoguttaceae bacterium]
MRFIHQRSLWHGTRRPDKAQQREGWVVFGVILVAVAGLEGCGSGRPKTVPVTGIVTLDGKPIEGANVAFYPDTGEATGTGGQQKKTDALTRPATGTTDKEGKFTLKTSPLGDGALPGKYKVAIIKKEVTGFLADKDGLSGGIAPEGIKEKWIIPPKYADPNNSGLTAEVKPGMRPLEFKLTSQ